MARRRTGAKPLPEPMMTQLNDAYMRHQASIYPNKAGQQTLHWRHNERDGVSNHQPHDCLLNCLFMRRSKEISKLPVTGVPGEFPAQRASNAENVSIWWRHHVKPCAYFMEYTVY